MASGQQLELYLEGAVHLERPSIARGEPEPVLVGRGTHQRVIDAAAGDPGRLELSEQRPPSSGAEEPAVREARRQEVCDGRRTAARGRRQTSQYRERLEGGVTGEAESARSRSGFGITSRPALSMVARMPQRYRWMRACRLPGKVHGVGGVRRRSSACACDRSRTSSAHCAPVARPRFRHVDPVRPRNRPGLTHRSGRDPPDPRTRSAPRP